MRGLEVALPFALPVAELPRGTVIWRLKNIGSFRASSAGMASILSKRRGCKALKAVTYPVSLAGNCRQLMLTVLKRMVAPYANARVWGVQSGPKHICQKQQSRLSWWLSRDVVESTRRSGTRGSSRKQYPKPCTEWVCSPYPTSFALFAVGDDKGRLCSISGTYLALRSGKRWDLTEVLTKICEDMPLSEVAATAPLLTQDAIWT